MVRAPRAITNRAGLPALSYRVGTQATFFESLLARLATFGVEAGKPIPQVMSAEEMLKRRIRRTTGSGLPQFAPSTWLGKAHLLRELLTTRQPSDPAIALFDAWATLADVLAFYQERIANEGFLRTAHEPRSLHELSRLVGYRPRPGVSSSVYLAFEVDDPAPQSAEGFGNNIVKTNSSFLIPQGTAAKSTPKPGTNEQPQTFETSQDLWARKEWNVLVPRRGRPHDLREQNLPDVDRLFFAGVGHRLKPNDLVAIDFDPDQRPKLRYILDIKENQAEQRTEVSITPDPLSPRQLIKRTTAVLDRFVEEHTSENQKLIRQPLKDAIVKVRRDIDEYKDRSVVDIDEALSKMLKDEFEEKSSGLRTRVQQLSAWAAELTKAFPPPSNASDGVFDPRQFLPALQKGVRGVIQRYKDHLTAVSELSSKLPAASELKERLVDVKSFLCDVRLLQVSASASALPKVHVALDESGSAELVFSGDSIKAKSRFTPYAPAGSAITFPADMQLPLSELAVTLRKKIDVPNNSFCIAHLQIESDEATPKHLASALRVLRGASFTSDGDFEGIEFEKTCPCPQSASSVAIDPDFKLPKANVVAAKKVYWAKIKALDTAALDTALPRSASHHYELKKVSDSEWGLVPDATPPSDRSLADFRDAIADVRIKAQRPSRVTFLVSVFDQAPPPAITPVPVVVFLRDVVFYSETRPPTFVDNNRLPSLLGRLARLHAELAVETTTGAQPKIDACFEDIDLPSFPSSIAALTSIEESTLKQNELSEALAANESARQRLDYLSPSVVSAHNREVRSELEELASEAREDIDTLLSDDAKSGQERLKSLMATFEGAQHANSTVLTEWRTNTLKSLVHERKNAAATLSDVRAAASAESFRDELAARAAELKKPFDNLLSEFNDVEAGIKKHLQNLRGEFGLRVTAIRKTFPQVTFSDQASNKLKEIVEKDTVSTLRERSCSLLGDPEFSCELSPQSVAALLETGNAEAAAKSSLQRMRAEWKTLIRQINLAPSPLSRQKLDIPDVEQAVASFQNLMHSDARVAAQAFATLAQLLAGNPDLIAQIAGRLAPKQHELLYDFLTQVRGGFGKPEPRIWVFRSKARLFGWNAPSSALAGLSGGQLVSLASPGVGCLTTDLAARARAELNLNTYIATQIARPLLTSSQPDDTESEFRLFLDAVYDQTAADSVIGIVKLGQVEEAFRVATVLTRPRSAYNLSSECSVITLSTDFPWWHPTANDFDVLRTTRVHCDAEVIPLANVPEPVTVAESNAEPMSIELDRVIFGLSSGDRLIVEGVPVLNETSGTVLSRELVQLIDIDHVIDDELFGDRFCTKLTFDRPLRHIYSRASMKIYANVVEATHGEMVREVLGSGDASKAFARFGLKRPELTRLPAPTPRGVERALEVRVNDVAWKIAEDFVDAKPAAETFVPFTNDTSQTAIVFGDGASGARVPTGTENVRAQYRAGLGRKGNVEAGQIDQAIGAPLGVKKVINPLPAQGGADPESGDRLRWNVPLAVTAMDRLVSVQDFADFANSYAGIGRASATRLQGVVHVTVASPEPEPFDMQGPIIRNLQRAFRLFGDPSQRFEVHDREASLLILVANVRLEPAYRWEKVEPQIREALLKQFSYETAELGQDLLLSDAISVVQDVAGVAYVDVDMFDAVRQEEVSQLGSRLTCLTARPRINVAMARLTSERQEQAKWNWDCMKNFVETSQNDECKKALEPGKTNDEDCDRYTPRFRAAQLCFLSPDIRDTLILKLLT